VELVALLIGREESSKAASGNVLRVLNESQIRKICGEVIYRAGVEVYNLGNSVSQKKFAENSLIGIIGVKGKKSTSNLPEISQFQSIITLEKEGNSKKAIRTYGECNCTLAGEGTICPHMAALLIAWVRVPKEFKQDPEHLRSKFEKERQNVNGTLEELLEFLQNGTDAEVFDVLQKTYARLRGWRDTLNEIGSLRGKREYNSKFDPVCELGGTINHVSLAILSAVGHKYKVRAIDIYNDATLTTFGKVLELFVENIYAGKSLNASSPVKREGKMISDPTNSSSSQKTTKRSWDMVIENFAKGVPS